LVCSSTPREDLVIDVRLTRTAAIDTARLP